MHIRSILLLLALVGALPVFGVATSRVEVKQQLEDRVESARRLLTILRAEGLSGLMDICSVEGFEPPAIDSNWKLSETVNPAERAAIEIERSLGRAILAELGDSVEVLWALELDQVPANVDRVLRVADWVGRSKAYGNAVVQREAREIALIGLGRLAADSATPISIVRRRQSRLFGGLNTTDHRRQILNREAGDEVFPESIVDDAGLTARWVERWKASGEEVDSVSPGGSGPLTGTPVGRGFFDPRPCRGVNALSCWERTNHEKLLGDFIDKAAFTLKGLIRFREIVGEIPTSEPRSLSGWPRLYTGFRQAWREKVGVGTERGVPYDAAVVVEQVAQGAFSRSRRMSPNGANADPE